MFSNITGALTLPCCGAPRLPSQMAQTELPIIDDWRRAA
jgi:hypothetical protein